MVWRRWVAVAVACAALAGCGGDSEDEAGCRDGASGPVAAYRATAPLGGPPAPGALDAAVRVMCERARARGMTVDVRQRGGGEIEIQGNATGRELAGLTATGRLTFYDWEPNVYGDPDQPLNSIGEAIGMAARAEPRAEATDVPSDRANDTLGDRYYLRGAKDATEFSTIRPRARPRAVKVPRGVLVVRAEVPAGATAGAPAQYFVVEDDVELSVSEIEDPKQGFDEQTREPVVTMEFTEAGRRAFARVTKRIAQRGQDSLPQPGGSPADRMQRFMIALDGQIVSLATIDFIANPDGISGETGAQINGIGSTEETRELADSLRIGALPVRLEPVR
jgi:SecD/SecF fusion protein